MTKRNQAASRWPGLTSTDWLLVGIAAYFVAIRLLFTFGVFPIADEAYYWMWGQHPALSYFDHPPLQAWLQAISHLFFGRSLFALRLPGWLATLGTVWIFYDVARRLGGDGWRQLFLKTLVIYLASPLYGMFTVVAFNDYLLVFLIMLSGYFFIRYFADVETAGKGRLRHLLIAAMVLGLAGLTKYNAGYLGLAVAGAVLLRPRLRHLLRSWELYAAAAIAIAFQAPVLLFALSNDFASFRFHLSDRFGTAFAGFNVPRMKSFILETLALASPFLIWASFRYFLGRGRSPFEDAGRIPSFLVFLGSSLTFLYISNFSVPNWWWNIAAFTLVLPVLGRVMGPVLLGLHVAWGAILSTVLVVTFSILPLSVLIGARPFLESARGFGWPQIVDAVTAAQAEHGADFLAANRYQLASQLGFALDRADIEALSDRRDAFDDWLDVEARRGKDAIIIVEVVDDTETFRKAFETVTKLGEIEIEQFGYRMKIYELYLGDNFIPPEPPLR